jgi:hypothetical protein
MVATRHSVPWLLQQVAVAVVTEEIFLALMVDAVAVLVVLVVAIGILVALAEALVVILILQQQ